MPIYDIRSISQVGTTEPFELQVGPGADPRPQRYSRFWA
jgi:hypothetical protein